MKATLQEAMDVLNGWRSAKAPLNCIFRSRHGDVMFHCGGYIIESAPDGVTISHSSGSYTFMISLAPASELDYQDPSEAPAHAAEWAAQNIISAIVVRFPTGYECILSEVNRDVVKNQQRQGW